MTLAVPAAVRSDARMDALRVLPLWKAVLRGDPFHCTVAPFVKFAPEMVSVNAVSRGQCRRAHRADRRGLSDRETDRRSRGDAIGGQHRDACRRRA